MKKLLIFSIIVFMVIACFGIVYIAYGNNTSEEWINGGEIKHRLIATYDDQTTGEISLNQPLFDISYEEKNIETISYILEGKIDGSPIQINVSEYNVVFGLFNTDVDRTISNTYYKQIPPGCRDPEKGFHGPFPVEL